MERATRLAGIACFGLWLLWSIRVGEWWIEFTRESVALRGAGVADKLTMLISAPFLGLLLSYRLLRQRRFRGAAITLVVCVLLTATLEISLDAWADYYVYTHRQSAASSGRAPDIYHLGACRTADRPPLRCP